MVGQHNWTAAEVADTMAHLSRSAEQIHAAEHALGHFDEHPADSLDPREPARCADCGQRGELTGHMGCQFPGYSEGRA